MSKTAWLRECLGQYFGGLLNPTISWYPFLAIIVHYVTLLIARKGNWHSNQNFDGSPTIPLFGASFSHFASSLMDGIINNSRRTLLISPMAHAKYMSRTRDVIQSAQKSYNPFPPSSFIHSFFPSIFMASKRSFSSASIAASHRETSLNDVWGAIQ